MDATVLLMFKKNKNKKAKIVDFRNFRIKFLKDHGYDIKEDKMLRQYEQLLKMIEDYESEAK